jgi:NADP-dependent 3-hydroxy acid dehydrogenase YdfG
LVLADIDEVKLEREGELLTNDGFNVVLQQLDVSDPSSVAELVSTVERTGPFRSFVYAAGLSPTMASAVRVLEVDMLGTEHVLSGIVDVGLAGYRRHLRRQHGRIYGRTIS